MTGPTLSMVTVQPFRIEGVRGARPKPGLMRQHLTAVNAAAEICGAQVEGAELRASTLVFYPGAIRAGAFRFAVGTAGSATLVAQTLLPALLMAPSRSTVHIEGGTHALWAPTFEFLDHAYIPALRRMSARVEATLHRPGFFPVGGGAIELRVEPSTLAPLVLPTPTELEIHISATVAKVPMRVARTEAMYLAQALGVPFRAPIRWTTFALQLSTGFLGRGRTRKWPVWGRVLPPPPFNNGCAHLRSTMTGPPFRAQDVHKLRDAACPGHYCDARFTAVDGTVNLFSAVGRRGVPAQAVADEVATAARRWRQAQVAVETHLADQLLLPMAMARGGRFSTTEVSDHSRSNAAVIEAFLPVSIEFERLGAAQVEVRTRRR